MIVLHWIAQQFDSANLFQTVAILVLLAISLPTFMLDKVVGHFAVHRIFKARDVRQITLTSHSTVAFSLTEEDESRALTGYNQCTFIQKRTEHLSSFTPPYLSIELHSGETIYIYDGTTDLDVQRTNSRGVPVATYWVRSKELQALLHEEFEEDAINDRPTAQK